MGYWLGLFRIPKSASLCHSSDGQKITCPRSFFFLLESNFWGIIYFSQNLAVISLTQLVCCPALPDRLPLTVLSGKKSSLSPAYIIVPMPHCFILLAQWVLTADCFALANAGRSRPARIAIIAITTNNSIRVNPEWERGVFTLFV